MKYIRIRNVDYWERAYGIGDTTAVADYVELYIENSPDGRQPYFFMLELHAMSSLARYMKFLTEEEKADPSYSFFLEMVNGLKNGSLDFFISELAYADFSPDINSCNQAYCGEKSILDFKSLPTPPFHGELFIGEERSLSPDLLIGWVKKLCNALFKQDFDLEFTNAYTYEQALENYKKNIL